MWANNRASDFKLFDLHRDRGEFDNIAHRHPQVVRELYETVRERAGGRLPYYE